MLDQQLAAALEQIGQGLPAARPVEQIVLVDLDPGQRAPLGAQPVAGQREFLLLGKMGFARGEPLLALDDGVRLHR